LDTVNNILSMKVDMVVMRHPAPGAAYFLSQHIDANIINAGDGTHEHPTQALLDAYSMRGAKVRVCGPPTLIPKYIEKLGVSVSYSVSETMAWCDVANLLRIQLERQDIKFFPSIREYAQYFGINQDIIDKTGKKIVIMHPGPINRGVEISSEVADSPDSIILQQVENGVAIRMAILYLLAAKR